MKEIMLHWVDQEGWDHYLKFSTKNFWELAQLTLAMQTAGIPVDVI